MKMYVVKDEELYLPEKGVRFIASHNGADSLVESSTDFNPIRN